MVFVLEHAIVSRHLKMLPLKLTSHVLASQSPFSVFKILLVNVPTQTRGLMLMAIIAAQTL